MEKDVKITSDDFFSDLKDIKKSIEKSIEKEGDQDGRSKDSSR